MTIAIVADDLTGAVDAAAPFARANAPLTVLPGPGAVIPAGGSWSLNAATRAYTRAAAHTVAEEAGHRLRGAATAFRKIDSLLRGHVAEEIATTARSGGFASVVIAPAFPAQGRVTRGGQHYARGADQAWRPVEIDLATELRERGVRVQVAPSAAALRGSGVFLCDAETEDDLAAIVRARARLAAPILWCGSGGLARALSGAAPLLAPPCGPFLGVIATQAPATLLALERLSQRAPQAVHAIARPDLIAAGTQVAAARLAAGNPIALVMRMPPLAVSTAASALECLAGEVRELRPAALFASGGDTLAAVVMAVSAEALTVTGEIQPGVPLSRMTGGLWDGVTVVSKAGAFAAEDLILRLFTTKGENGHGEA